MEFFFYFGRLNNTPCVCKINIPFCCSTNAQNTSNTAQSGCICWCILVIYHLTECVLHIHDIIAGVIFMWFPSYPIFSSHICPSVCQHERIFMKFDIWVFFENLSKKFKLHLPIWSLPVTLRTTRLNIQKFYMGFVFFFCMGSGTNSKSCYTEH